MGVSTICGCCQIYEQITEVFRFNFFQMNIIENIEPQQQNDGKINHSSLQEGNNMIKINEVINNIIDIEPKKTKKEEDEKKIIVNLNIYFFIV